MENEITVFGEVLLFILTGFLFVVGGLLTSKIIRPDRPSEAKMATYESGEVTVGDAWGQVNVRFYILALIFLLFEVEIIFLFPWAVVFGNEELIAATDGAWAWFTFVEMFIFLGILFLGLVYAWKKGFLDWPLGAQRNRSFSSPVPPSMYEAINKKYES